MGDQSDEHEREKKAYRKPQIHQVALRPEEAVLGVVQDQQDIRDRPKQVQRALGVRVPRVITRRSGTNP